AAWLVGPDGTAGANRDARLPVLLSGWRAAASEVVRILRIACRSRTWDDALQTIPDVLPVVLRPTPRAALRAIWVVVLSGVAAPLITVRHASPVLGQRALAVGRGRRAPFEGVDRLARAAVPRRLTSECDART